jgi:hypothetical protein
MFDCNGWERVQGGVIGSMYREITKAALFLQI